MEILITKQDLFVWLIISEKQAKALFEADSEVYIIYDDESESLIEKIESITEDKRYGVEIGFLTDLTNGLH